MKLMYPKAAAEKNLTGIPSFPPPTAKSLIAFVLSLLSSNKLPIIIYLISPHRAAQP